MRQYSMGTGRKTLRGRIVDQDGKPIAGAIVNVSEASRIALSDQNGYFSLKKVKDADEICVSSVGYLSTTAFAEFNDSFQIVMLPDLDEYLHTTAVPFGRKAKNS